MDNIKPIFSKAAPKPGGHYSQAIQYNGMVFISGVLPITVEGEKLTDAPIEVQTRLCLKNIEAILQEAGSQMRKLLSVTIYISDGAHWGSVNQTYAEVLGDHKPARAIVPVKDLHYGLAIEIQAIAAV